MSEPEIQEKPKSSALSVMDTVTFNLPTVTKNSINQIAVKKVNDYLQS